MYTLSHKPKGYQQLLVRMDPLSPEESLLPRIFRATHSTLRPLVILRDPVERLYSAYYFFGCASSFVYDQDRIKSHTGPFGPTSFHAYVQVTSSTCRDFHLVQGA